MDDETAGHLGGCHCGAIRYRTARHTGNAYVCNCLFCQKATGSPFLVEHCFSRQEVELLSGTPAIYTHVSEGSGKEVYLHFCRNCGSQVFLTLERWPDTRNIFTATLDDPQEVDYGPETLRYLFLDSAQSGMVTPRGFEAFRGHCSPASGETVVAVVASEHTPVRNLDETSGPHAGGCLCGRVRFEADGDPTSVVVCHCRSCQKSSGAAMNIEVMFGRHAFRLTRGSSATYSHQSRSAEGMVNRNYCARCGSSLWLTGDGFPEVGVFRGALDRPNRIEISPDTTVQIFTDDALPCGMIVAGIETFRCQRRSPDGTLTQGRVPETHHRAGDGT